MKASTWNILYWIFAIILGIQVVKGVIMGAVIVLPDVEGTRAPMIEFVYAAIILAIYLGLFYGLMRYCGNKRDEQECEA